MGPDAVRLVIERELALLSSDVRRSRDAVGDLLDPDFREVGGSGRLWTRDEMIAALTAESAGEQDEIVATQLAGITLNHDLVLLTYVSTRGTRRARRASLWRRRAGAWRVLYHQGTPVDDD